MKSMPIRHELDRAVATATAQTSTPSVAASPEWRQSLPVLTGAMVTLRELQLSDASSLLTMLTAQEVARFISPAPPTLEGFERFILWAHRERERGNYVCYAVVPHGHSTAVGLFQVRQLEAGFATAEWGFAIGSAYWGTGMFADAANLVLDFAFQTLRVHRLEARAAVMNGRGNGALRKIGAVQEAVLRRSFRSGNTYLDQTLWSILDSDWRQARSALGPQVLVH